MSSGPQKQDEDAGQAVRLARQTGCDGLNVYCVIWFFLFLLVFLVRFAVLPASVTFTRNIDDVGKDEVLGGFS